MNSSLQFSFDITETGGSGLSTATSTTLFGDTPTNSVSGNSASLSWQYYVEQSETGSNVTWTVTDIAGNTASLTFDNITLDNDGPATYTIADLYDPVYGSCTVIDVSNITDAGAGFHHYYLLMNGDMTNYTESGSVEYCYLVAGIWTITSAAVDNVGNIRTANSITVQAIIEEGQTQYLTASNAEMDWLQSGEDLLASEGQFLQHALLVLIGVGVIVLIFRRRF